MRLAIAVMLFTAAGCGAHTKSPEPSKSPQPARVTTRPGQVVIPTDRVDTGRPPDNVTFQRNFRNKAEADAAVADYDRRRREYANGDGWEVLKEGTAIDAGAFNLHLRFLRHKATKSCFILYKESLTSAPKAICDEASTRTPKPSKTVSFKAAPPGWTVIDMADETSWATPKEKGR